MAFAIFWDTLLKYTTSSPEPIIIEKVEPPMPNYLYLLEEKNLPTTVKSMFIVVLVAYIFFKVNFCLLRALRGIFMIVGVFTLICFVVDKYESLPEPVILVLNSFHIYVIEAINHLHKLLATMNLPFRAEI